MKKYSLPAEFGNKWVATLRSGEYQQGTGELTIARDDETPGFDYCCLGVACKVVGIKDNVMHPYNSLGHIASQSEGIFIKAGIPRELMGTELEQTLIVLNDNENYTFNQIADWLTENVNFI